MRPHTCDATDGAPARHSDAGAANGPVLLATLQGARFTAEAVDFALGTAVELGLRLLVVNVVEAPVGVRGRGPAPNDPPSVTANLRAPVLAARACGVEADLARVLALRPVATLVGIVRAERPAVVVFGARPGSHWRPLSRRRQCRAVRALEAATTCLLWHAELGGADGIGRPSPALASTP
jgi:hypothetical protein